jgi:ABC-type molybdate transport system substrate-binding protein
MLGLALMGALAVTAATASAAEPVIYSAGSLRSSLTDMIQQFAAKTGVYFTPVYGPSGKLRERIEQGQHADVFASASVKHTQALAKEGLLKSSHVLAENSMCLVAAPGIHLQRDKLLDILLNPALRVGTSTPKADPAGDYTWELFHKADKLRPGAYAVLDKKALKLMGHPAAPGTRPLSISEMLTSAKQADLFIIYCNEAAEEAHKTPGLTYAAFPASLDVPSYYGIGATRQSGASADAFVRFALGAEGQAILKKHGFKSAAGK